MKIDRIVRVNELLRREIAEALFHVIDEADVDVSALTVTHVHASRDLRRAQVWLSIRGYEDSRPAILARVLKHRSELQAWINRTVKLKYTPRLTFTLDLSLERGDHVLALLSDIEPAADEPGPEIDVPAAPGADEDPACSRPAGEESEP